MAAHLLRRQLLEPHWEKKAAEVVALERAKTLYGIVIYKRPARALLAEWTRRPARDLHPRAWSMAAEWDTRLPFTLPTTGWSPGAELEHKSRRQDVLVDDELIVAFTTGTCPPTCTAGMPASSGTAPGRAAQPGCCMLARRTDAPRRGRDHHRRLSATVRLGGVDCAASYRTNLATRETAPR